MNSKTAGQLLDLNRQFYQTFALQFSATRQRLQPGVRKVCETLPRESRILDLGCGNGELWRELALSGHEGPYVGLDFSTELLEIARQRAAIGQATFVQADLSEPGWETALPDPGRQFDVALAFAVLHHLPGKELRSRVVRQVRRLLAPGGRFIHSEWQFLNSQRLRQRILPWETANIAPEDVDPGDALLDWRQGGAGTRYAHHFDEAELQGLAQEGGFSVAETFYSDGEGGRLGLYQVWELA